MQKPELIGAFKIGTQKGHSVEEIKHSLANAGYPIQDIEDSALAFSQGLTKPTPKPLPVTPKAKTPTYLVIAIIVSAIIVLGLLGFVIYKILSS